MLGPVVRSPIKLILGERELYFKFYRFFKKISSLSFDVEFALPRARLLNAFLTSEKKTSFNFQFWISVSRPLNCDHSSGSLRYRMRIDFSFYSLYSPYRLQIVTQLTVYGLNIALPVCTDF